MRPAGHVAGAPARGAVARDVHRVKGLVEYATLRYGTARPTFAAAAAGWAVVHAQAWLLAGTRQGGAGECKEETHPERMLAPAMGTRGSLASE